jgi:hypothetical protein
MNAECQCAAADSRIPDCTPSAIGLDDDTAVPNRLGEAVALHNHFATRIDVPDLDPERVGAGLAEVLRPPA